MSVLRTTTRRRVVIAALAALLLATAGCATSTGRGNDVAEQGARDAAGATRQQVERMSLREEFDLAGERYERGQALLADAQARISDGVWTWNGGDVLPLPGDDAFGDVPDGATAENSYSFRTVRIIHPEGGTGAAADLEPMRRWFDEEGWRSRSAEIGQSTELRADTGDGWWVTWTVRKNGQYSVGVYSETFWTNDTDALVEAIAVRDPADFPEESAPGVSAPFPKWSDPVREP